MRLAAIRRAACWIDVGASVRVRALPTVAPRVDYTGITRLIIGLCIGQTLTELLIRIAGADIVDIRAPLLALTIALALGQGSKPHHYKQTRCEPQASPSAGVNQPR